MNWIDIVWPIMSAAGIVLAAIHLLIWFKQRDQKAQLAFALVALSVACIGILERLGMQASTPEAYAPILRWGHVPFATMVIGIVFFVRLNFRAGNLALGLAVCLIRLLSLLANFGTGVNLHFQRITEMYPVQWGGVTIHAPVGEANPWMWVGQLSLVLLLVYLIDALTTVWQRGNARERTRALLVCGSIIAFMLFSAGWAIAVVRHGFRAPITINPAFVPVLLAMSYELGGDILRSAQLARSLAKTESDLRTTEQRMELAVHAAGLGLWGWDRDTGGNLWLSEAAAGVLGFAPGETFDRERFFARVHPDDLEMVRQTLSEAAHGKGELWREFRVLRPDGRIRWIVARGQAEFDASQELRRFSGVVIDVTERKEAALRFQLVVEAAPTAMLMVATDGAISLANREAENVFGYAPAELVQMNVDQLVPMSFRGGHGDERAKYAKDATARAMGAGRELFGLRKDGGEVPIEIALNPIHTDDGLFVLASIVDISERKRLERESALQRDELAHLSRVALLSELSGSLAHELNQPLTAILSNAQAAVRFLAHSPPNLDEVSESLTNIVENDKRAGEVIRRLRAMLRKDPADYRRLDMNEVVQDMMRIIRSDLLNRNVELALELEANLPPIVGDRVQLQQVLLNLVMNASDAMNELADGRALTVRTQANAGGVLVSVVDVGTGIPPDDLELIFSPFITSKGEGMGLGLAVCTTIIQTHGGRLWAINNAERGATLHFHIPESAAR